MKRKILVVDDEAQVRGLLSRALAREPYELIGAADGRQALAAAEQEQPDAILLDLDMPGKSGWDVLRELRLNLATRLIPVILLTGSNGAGDRVGGLRLGADDYVTKPFDLEELRARLAGILRRCEAERSASPLTGLPGSPAIEEEARRRLAEGSPFAFLYADVNHFKPYNDVYGFERGDVVIRETARLLVETVQSVCEDGFVGHIGGDDFVALVPAEHGAVAANRLACRFDELAPGFYEPADLARGGLRARDREGLWRDYPLLSLSIGAVVAAGERDEYARLVRAACEMKAWCKAQPERGLSRFGFDRRSQARARV